MLLPVRTTSVKNLTPQVGKVARVGALPAGCSYFGATQQVGRGFVMATQQLSAHVCWNGKRVWQDWGLNRNDCGFTSNTLTYIDTRCRTRFLQNGSMHVTYTAVVSPALLPFVHPDATIHLWIRPNGKVVRFP